MKKYIIRILLFFGIVAVFDFGVGQVGYHLQTHAKGGNTKRTNDLMMADRHDVLILGSSRARHHYDTPYLCQSLGLDVYNAGYDGNGVVLAYGLLAMISDRYHPKLVILDVEPAFDIYEYQADDSHKRYINELKPYYRNESIAKVIKDVSIYEWYKVHSGLVRYNSSLFSMGIDNVRGKKDTQAGFLPLHGAYNREPTKHNGWENIDTFKLEYVENILKLASERGIPIIVVASPKLGEVSSSELDPVKDICSRMNVAFLDYYADDLFMKHKEWFKEPMHLNAEGARNYSVMIAKDVKSFIRK